MKFYGKAEGVAKRIVEAFQSGKVPAAMAQVFIQRGAQFQVPCRKWSFLNQFSVMLAGHSDARGYRQWEAVGRCVRKGEKAVYILVPLVGNREVQDKTTGEKTTRKMLYGFKGTPVFGFSQTDGEPLPVDTESAAFLDSLPFVEVAKKWGISVEVFDGSENGPLGFFSPGKSNIGLGVKNLSTWAHEMSHAADKRLKTLVEFGQNWKSETVAELAGCVLLNIIGKADAADAGGAWEYIRSYTGKAGVDPIDACMKLLNRVSAVVALILEEAGYTAPDKEDKADGDGDKAEDKADGDAAPVQADAALAPA